MLGNERLMFLGLGSMHLALFFLMLYVANLGGQAIPFSPDAFIQPYFSQFPLLAMILLALILPELYYYYFMLVPSALPNPKQHLILLVMPEIFAVFGFVIGFFYKNPWAALPYFVLGVANYIYGYMKITQQRTLGS